MYSFVPIIPYTRSFKFDFFLYWHTNFSLTIYCSSLAPLSHRLSSEERSTPDLDTLQPANPSTNSNSPNCLSRRADERASLSNESSSIPPRQRIRPRDSRADLRKSGVLIFFPAHLIYSRHTGGILTKKTELRKMGQKFSSHFHREIKKNCCHHEKNGFDGNPPIVNNGKSHPDSHLRTSSAPHASATSAALLATRMEP